jgi:hypothetical protein
MMGLSKDQQKEIQTLEKQGLKRFMVGEVQEQVVLHTVFAKTANDAVKLVIGGAGRPAGLEGPTTLFHLAKEIGLTENYKQGDFAKAFAALRNKVAEMQQQKRIVTPNSGDKRIIVPTVVPPKDLR